MMICFSGRIGVLVATFLLLSAKSVISGEIILSGIYQGRDLYISNPLLNGENKFCIQRIQVNDVIVVADPESSVCRIVLSHLTVGQPVVVRVEYTGDCQPEFINPQVVGNKDPVSFGEIQAGQSWIKWHMNGIIGRTLFFIEKRKDNQWIIVNSSEVFADGSRSEYSVTVEHANGSNRYRIRAVTDGSTVYSGIFIYESDDEKVTFYPKRVSDKITLSEEKDYEILDVMGNRLIKGKESEIWVNNLDPGIYYIVIDEKIEKFLKK